MSMFYATQVCLFSTSAVHTDKEPSHHFREKAQRKYEPDDDDHTKGNEAYRMPHPIW